MPILRRRVVNLGLPTARPSSNDGYILSLFVQPGHRVSAADRHEAFPGQEVLTNDGRETLLDDDLVRGPRRAPVGLLFHLVGSWDRRRRPTPPSSSSGQGSGGSCRETWSVGEMNRRRSAAS